jgi:hypothetical protein
MRLAMVASWLALMILGVSLAAVRAADEPSSIKGVEPPSVGSAATEIDRLAAELDAPRYSERQSASEKLAALGAAALPALEKAAKGESLEVTTRAIELLKKLLDASEASTQADARQAFQRLAKGDQVQKASPQSRTDLKQAIDQFKQTLAEVEKRLQEKPEAPAAKPDASRGANKPE